LENWSSWIEDLVYSMPNPHDLFLLTQGALNICVNLVQAANFLKHVNDAFVRSAVKRTLQSCDSSGDSRVNIGQRRDCNPGTEGRGIHPVLGVQNVSEIQGLCLFLRRDFPIQQIEKMSGLAKILPYRWKLQSVSGAMKVGHD